MLVRNGVVYGWKNELRDPASDAQVHTKWTWPDWSSSPKAATTRTVRKRGAPSTLTRNRKNVLQREPTQPTLYAIVRSCWD